MARRPSRLLVMVLGALAASTAQARWLPRFMLEWPEAAFMPNWLSLPWGPVPNWELIHRTIECRNSMRKSLDAIQSSCEKYPNQRACGIKVKLVGLHAHEYIKNEGGRFDFARMTTELKHKYCQRWGFCESIVLMEPTFDSKHRAKERSPPWSKVLAVQGEVAKGDFDWYMWLDGDAAFIDHSIDIRFIIARATMPEYGGDANKFFLVSKDVWSTPGNGASNTGVWLIKNGTDSLAFLQEWWEVPDKVQTFQDSKQNRQWEQKVFNEYLYDKHVDRITRLDDCWLFGHPLSLIDQPFIAHLCGIPNSYKQHERLTYFTFWNDRTKV